jgi:5-methylcytosine-specific restriction protein A
LSSCRTDATLKAYERDEGLLIDHALTLSAEDFSQLVQAWRMLADPDGFAAQRRQDAQTARVHLSRTLDGWWVLSGLLPPEEGELVHAALAAGVDRRLRAAHDGDPAVVGRPVASWRADALVDLATQSMRREPSEQSVPDRYRIGLVLRPSELERAPVTALCDSAVYRLVIGAKSETLDVGRSTSVWPVGLRRAITARDGGCVFPGCDRPPSWCDVHHCRPWSEGGDTYLDNGAMLCRRHHAFVHRYGWLVVTPVARGTPEVRRPDGSLFIVRRSDPGRAAAA